MDCNSLKKDLDRFPNCKEIPDKDQNKFPLLEIFQASTFKAASGEVTKGNNLE